MPFGQPLIVPKDAYTKLSRHEDPAKTANISPTAHTFVEVVHCQCNSAVIAQAETSAWPHDNTARRTLADNTLRSSELHVSGMLCPRASIAWRVGTGCILVRPGSRIRELSALVDEILQQLCFFLLGELFRLAQVLRTLAS